MESLLSDVVARRPPGSPPAVGPPAGNRYEHADGADIHTDLTRQQH
jgi:hypothetical protein